MQRLSASTSNSSLARTIVVILFCAVVIPLAVFAAVAGIAIVAIVIVVTLLAKLLRPLHATRATEVPQDSVHRSTSGPDSEGRENVRVIPRS